MVPFFKLVGIREMPDLAFKESEVTGSTEKNSELSRKLELLMRSFSVPSRCALEIPPSLNTNDGKEVLAAGLAGKAKSLKRAKSSASVYRVCPS